MKIKVFLKEYWEWLRDSKYLYFLYGFIFSCCLTILAIHVYADETSIVQDEVIVEEPIEEVPVEEAPVEEAPVEESPFEEAPVEEVPIEEVPVNENQIEVVQEGEVNVSIEDGDIISESGSEIAEQSIEPVPSDSSDSVPVNDPENIVHPENLDDVPRDENGDIYIPKEEIDLQTQIDRYEDLLSTEQLNVFKYEEINVEDLSDWSVSQYYKAVITQALYEILGTPEENEEESEEDEIEVLQAIDERLITMGVLDSPFLSANRNQGSIYKNVVVYHGQFNSEDVDLIVPYEAYSKLLVENNYLVNVSNETVTGKFLYDGALLDPSEYDAYSYIINPIYGSTSNVYNYGSFNYRRHYFLQSYSGGQRITYNDMYGNFYVSDVDIYYTNSERTYYGILFILLFMGVNFLWNRRH